MASLFQKLFRKPRDINSELEQMNDIITFSEGLNLNFDYGTSEFKKKLILQEFQEIYKPKISELLTIETVFLYHGFEGTEAGIFIINTSDEPIELYKVRLGIMSEYGSLAGECDINFNGEVRVAPNSSFYYEVLFEGIHLNESIKNLNVVFSDIDELKVSYTNDIDIENVLHNQISEHTKDFFREKFYNLPSLREGEFIVDPIFALGDDDGVSIIILFRNGSDKDIILKSIPIVISMKENLPVYIGNIELDKEEFLIEKNKGKLSSFKLPAEAIMVKPIKNYSYKLSFK